MPDVLDIRPVIFLSTVPNSPMFTDRVTIVLEAGRGGDGCLSFRRERFVPRGGPNGGDGGHGGSIHIIAKVGVDSLAALSHRKLWQAERGRHGQGSNRQGRSGQDMLIHVPPGTIVRDDELDFVLKDLAGEGDRVTAARGGKGGRGNTSFKSSTNRAPRQFTRGEQGEHRRISLELKVIADVGLIGKPNAGKSTLLSRLSHARPEIADYPFTTKYPNLGRVDLNLDRSLVMADIPGLIDGAHSGIGLGHEFLRHVERAGVLVHLIEPAPVDGSDPVHNYHAIRSELRQYDQRLSDRREIIVVTKADLPDAVEVWQRLAAELSSVVFLVSAATGEGLKELTVAIFRALDEQKDSA